MPTRKYRKNTFRKNTFRKNRKRKLTRRKYNKKKRVTRRRRRRGGGVEESYDLPMNNEYIDYYNKFNDHPELTLLRGLPRAVAQELHEARRAEKAGGDKVWDELMKKMEDINDYYFEDRITEAHNNLESLASEMMSQKDKPALTEWLKTKLKNFPELLKARNIEGRKTISNPWADLASYNPSDDPKIEVGSIVTAVSDYENYGDLSLKREQKFKVTDINKHNPEWLEGRKDGEEFKEDEPLPFPKSYVELSKNKKKIKKRIKSIKQEEEKWRRILARRELLRKEREEEESKRRQAMEQEREQARREWDKGREAWEIRVATEAEEREEKLKRERKWRESGRPWFGVKAERDAGELSRKGREAEKLVGQKSRNRQKKEEEKKKK
jgi:hypothetical protein